MGRYRKVDPRIWNDSKFISLPERGKLAFLFLLTHPHMTALGAMRATFDGLAAELGCGAKQFKESIAGAVESGMVEVNEQAAYICLPKFLRYNEPEGPNSVTKAWLRALELIPECHEKENLILRCRDYLEGKRDTYRHALSDGIRDAFGFACRIQEQEQEQDNTYKSFFEEFWESYPTRDGRKVGKAKSQELFAKLHPPDVPLVISAAKLYAASKRAKEGYAKDPFRFLQSDFWRDWVQPSSHSQKSKAGKNLCFE